MGVTERVKDTIDVVRGKKKVEEETKTKLEKIGLSFLASEETKDRIARKKELFNILYSPLEGKTPEEKIKDLYDKVNKINMILHETDIPYGRGGERSWFSQIVFAYTDIFSISQIFIESTMRQIERINEQKKQKLEKNQPVSLERLQTRKETLLINIEHFYVRITRAYAEKIASCSWFPEDVGRNWAAIIQNISKEGGINPRVPSSQNPLGAGE